MKLNIGCGKSKLKGYVNLDISPNVDPDIIRDIERGLPFSDNTFEEVFSSHTLEHMKDLIFVMNEIWRVCKPDSLVRIIVPYYKSPWAFQDPTHVRFFTEDSLKYFCGFVDTFSEYGMECNFELVEQEIIAEYELHAVLRAVKPATDEQAKLFESVQLAQIAELERGLEEKTAEIQALQISLEAREVKISALLTSLEEKSAQISAQHGELASIQHMLMNSILWRAGCKLGSFVNRLLPLGTRRRYLFDNAITAFRNIMNEGWGRPRPKIAFLKVHTFDEVDPYQLWIAENEPSEEDLARYRQESLTFPYRPKISIVTPVWNPEKEWLRLAIESVINQAYGNWELCIADGGSTESHVKELLDEYAERDSRIMVKFLPQNSGISGNSNEALSLATGEFIGLLDHDDELAPSALYEVVKCLNKNPDLDLIYSDRDKKTADNKQRFNPLFKPDWSPEMMLCCNYITHMCIIRKILVDEVGGFIPETDGAQDWDLFLRVTEKTEKIYHIPKILYHWRASYKSCAEDTEYKPYVYAAQLSTVQAHLHRQGLSAELCIAPPGMPRVKWHVTNRTKVSIIIPTKDKVQMLRSCVNSVLNITSYENFELIIVDTGSRDAATLYYYDDVSANPKVRVINYHDQPFNYSAVCNLGARQATGDALLFLNNDTEVINADWLEEMVGWVEQKAIGVVGAKLLNLDGTIQHAGFVIGLMGFGSVLFDGAPEGCWTMFGFPEWYRNLLAVGGSCMMIRREVFEEVGGYDETFILSHSDIELCLRVREKGYRVVYVPYAKIKHRVGGTRGEYNPPEDWELWYEHCKSILEAGDPYFNPNLSYFNPIPTLRKKGEPSTIDFAQEWLRVEARQLSLPLIQRFCSALARAENQHAGQGGDASSN